MEYSIPQEKHRQYLSAQLLSPVCLCFSHHGGHAYQLSYNSQSWHEMILAMTDYPRSVGTKTQTDRVKKNSSTSGRLPKLMRDYKTFRQYSIRIQPNDIFSSENKNAATKNIQCFCHLKISVWSRDGS